MRRRLIFALVLLLDGCSSPSPALYTIAPVDGPTHANSPPVVLLEQVALEHYLERSQIVRSSENYRLDVMSNDWWGEPLSAMMSRVLVTELGQRLPSSLVISESGAISATPDATIALNIRRMDEDASGTLILHAQVSVTLRKSARPAMRDLSFRVAPPTSGTAGEVAAISQALGQLADAIAGLIAQR